MNLLNLINGSPDLATLRGFALILTPAHHATLTAAQAALPERTLVVEPQPLADGRWMLCADVLAEVHPGGIYSEGFGRLPQSVFPEVEVLPIAEALALRPQAAGIEL